MVSSNSHDEKAGNGRTEVSLFESVSHDTRIRILFLLRDRNLGFAELKNQLEIKSGGNLQHHIGKLGTLVCINEEGLYSLTEQGREAIMAIKAVRPQQRKQKETERMLAAVKKGDRVLTSGGIYGE